MLILTRREGESLVILIPGTDETIEVRIVKAGAQVSLGVDAPQDVEVLREELAQEQPAAPASGEHTTAINAS